MNEISNALVLKLIDKGLLPLEIQRLIKDIVNIARDGGSLDIADVKQALHQLGWENNVIDESVFEQILFCIEYEIRNESEQT